MEGTLTDVNAERVKCHSEGMERGRRGREEKKGERREKNEGERREKNEGERQE